MRVPWSVRSNQPILKEINVEYSFEGLMLKLDNGMQHSNKNELLIHAIPLMNLEIIMLNERSLTKVMYSMISFI